MANFLVWETDAHHNKQTAQLRAVCTSKRQAVTVAVNSLLEAQVIGTADMAETKDQLNGNSQTQGLTVNYLIQEIEPNKPLL